MKVGVLDIGSNSLRGLWGDVDEDLCFIKRGAKLLTTRLGEGMSSVERVLREEAVERTLKGLLELCRDFRDNGVTEVYAFATSAVREASNKDWFLTLVRLETGLNVDVLSGREEAFQNLLGVEVGLGIKDHYLLFDIGGGSTEIILKNGEDVFLKSIPIGALKLKRVRFSSLNEGVSFLKKLWEKELASIRSSLQGVKNFVGVGGTLSALALFKEGLSFYDIRIAHGNRIELDWLADKILYLSRLSQTELESFFSFDPGRSYVIYEGSLILLSLMDFLGIPSLLVSETNLLWGGLVKKWGVKKFLFGS